MITIQDLYTYLSSRTDKHVHTSRALQTAIDVSMKYIPPLKKYSNSKYDSKLTSLQAYVKTLVKTSVKTNRNKRKNTIRHKRYQRGGNSEVYASILLTIFAGLIIIWKLRQTHTNVIPVHHPVPVDVINNINTVIRRASYDPDLLDELRENYPTYAENIRSYIDIAIMSEYGTTLADFVIQPMPPHPIHYNEDVWENENDYIGEVAVWEQAYIARNIRGLPLPDENVDLLPSGLQPSLLLFTTANAEHIGERNIPAESDNIISMNTIENGDEMVELHERPMHYYKRSSINSLLSAPGPWPKTNPLTAQNITSPRNMKRYTARVRRNKHKNKND